MSTFIPNRQEVVDGTVAPVAGYQQITGLSTVKTLIIPASARFAMISVEGKPVRYLDDGQTPTASFGMPIAAGETRYYTGDLSALKFIESSASAVINVSYYR